MSSRNPKVSRKTLVNIIQEVYKRPCLWNPDDEHYNNRARVAVAWEEVTAALNIPETVIRSKWKSLRDIFKRELMKKCKTKSQGMIQYRGKWRYFNSMLFLHNNDVTPLADHDAREISSSSTEPEDIKEEIVNNNRNMDESDDNNVAFNGGNIFAVDFQPDQDPLPVKRLQSSEDDYDLMFLKSLVPFFRELDPVRKLKIRNKIQDIIINEISAQGNYSMH